MFDHDKKLIRESEWMRIYEIYNPKGYLFESKFLLDDLQVAPSTIRDRWPRLSEGEKIEFASAFSSQPPRHDDDQQILVFLMEVGPEEVWRAIANLLPFSADRQRALDFIHERVLRAPSGRRANYYQAIESLRALSVTSTLREHYEEYVKRLGSETTGSGQFELWADYLQCAKTLLVLTQDPTFESALQEARMTAPSALRASAARLLEEAKKG